ncbi:MAG: DUF262 domain-containing protein [Actinophytocola sp.]|uniref:DUF262 domain-containing protein n=1 Tax=Actinophytocola sp. TaxID=1872138 RepID=UPI003C76EFD2
MARTAARASELDADAAEAQIVELGKRIEFYITEYSVELLANKMHDGEYVVPDYQREFTWEPERKSKFLESILLGLPIPFVFFWEMPDGRLEIVDGSQRLRTIEEFIKQDFRLGELDQLTHVSGFRFVDLPRSRQRKLLNRSIRGIVLNEHADEAARLDMFNRINTGSKQANMAEIRRGALAGPFIDLVVDLAKNPDFIRLAPVSDKALKEREREELITRFFAYGDGLDGYRDRPSDFIFDYAKALTQRMRDDPALVDEYRDRFIKVIEFVSRVFPHGFTKTPSGRATPRARFESIAIGTYWAMKEKPEIATYDATRVNVAKWLEGGEFSRIARSDGANVRQKLEGRITFVKNQLVDS